MARINENTNGSAFTRWIRQFNPLLGILSPILSTFAPKAMDKINNAMGNNYAGETATENFINDLAPAFESLKNKWTGQDLTLAQYKEYELNALEAEKARNFNAEEAEKARQFEMEMSNTSHQRAVADMRAAGINPVLAAGAGASTPSGNAASGPAASAGNNNNGMSMSDLMAALMLPTEIEVKKAEAENVKADTNKKEAETNNLTQMYEFLNEVNPLRVEAQRISNNLSTAQERKIYKEVEEIEQTIKFKIKQTDNEELRGALIHAETILKDANARQIVEMLPYQKALTIAQTEAQKAAAALSIANAAYQNKLISSGYIDAMMRELEARAASQEAIATINEIKAAIRDGSYGKMEFNGNIPHDVVAAVNNAGCQLVTGLVQFVDNLNPLGGLLK